MGALPIVASSVFGFILSGCAVHDGKPGDCEHGLGKTAGLLHAMQKGWKVDAEAGIMLSTTKHVFDLCAEHVSIDEETTAHIEIMDASTVDQQSRNIAASVGAGASAGAFSVAVSASSSFAKGSQ